jgi:hypothetical protein
MGRGSARTALGEQIGRAAIEISAPVAPRAVNGVARGEAASDSTAENAIPEALRFRF